MQMIVDPDADPVKVGGGFYVEEDVDAATPARRERDYTDGIAAPDATLIALRTYPETQSRPACLDRLDESVFCARGISG